MERVAHLEQVVEQQAARIASLETELARRKGRGSGGARASSSESASQGSRRSGKRRSSGRSPGGQPGHEGHGRSLVSVEQVDELVPIKPSTCRRCGQALCGDDPHPLRHQEVVIPPVRAQVIEYQFHTLRCRHCYTLTEAPWPEGVSRRTFGPSVQAWVGLLSGAYRLSKRNIVALLSDAFGVHLCPGTVSQLEQEVSAAIAEPVEAARAYVRQQPTVNLDETGWRECRLRAWLWVVITAGVSVFAIRRSRGREVVDELLGNDSTAIVGSDRFSAYGHLPPARRQVCWAHLRRTFEDFVARGGQCRSETAGVYGAAVYLVASNPRWHPATVELPGLRQSPSALPGSFRTLVWAAVRRRQDGRNLRQSARHRAGPVDLRAQERRRRAHEQRGRARPSAWSPVAPYQLRHPQPRRKPLRRTDAYRA